MPFGRVGRQTEDVRTDQVKALIDAAEHQADGAGNDPEPDAETGEDDEAAEGGVGFPTVHPAAGLARVRRGTTGR
ncbi:hypothetical protein [Streptomyces sp. NPDC006739]|uniref:hypothetical protein n=1 Tax=Streptomyces sp. NPDC006739 TaxID=3364763 RepID=UPI00368ACB76